MNKNELVTLLKESIDTDELGGEIYHLIREYDSEGGTKEECQEAIRELFMDKKRISYYIIKWVKNITSSIEWFHAQNIYSEYEMHFETINSKEQLAEIILKNESNVQRVDPFMQFKASGGTREEYLEIFEKLISNHEQVFHDNLFKRLNSYAEYIFTGRKKRRVASSSEPVSKAQVIELIKNEAATKSIDDMADYFTRFRDSGGTQEEGKEIINIIIDFYGNDHPLFDKLADLGDIVYGDCVEEIRIWK